MADPGFPREGGANPKRGHQPITWANFSRKLHENEEILGGGRGASDATAATQTFSNI